MFKHCVYGSEVTLMGGSELIGLSPKITEHFQRFCLRWFHCE